MTGISVQVYEGDGIQHIIDVDKFTVGAPILGQIGWCSLTADHKDWFACESPRTMSREDAELLRYLVHNSGWEALIYGAKEESIIWTKAWMKVKEGRVHDWI